MKGIQDQRGVSTNAMIGIIAVVIIVVGGIAYYAYNNKATNTSESKNTTTQSAPKKTATVKLFEQNDSKESGTVTLTEAGEKVEVAIKIDGEPADANQPAHIHAGVCPNPGGVLYPLNPVIGGSSTTMIDVTLDTLLSQLPLAINLHKTATELKAYVSCGDITNNAK